MKTATNRAIDGDRAAEDEWMVTRAEAAVDAPNRVSCGVRRTETCPVSTPDAAIDPGTLDEPLANGGV